MVAHCRRLVSRFLQGEDGPTAVEYAIMLAMVLVVVLVAIATLDKSASGDFATAAAQTGNSS